MVRTLYRNGGREAALCDGVRAPGTDSEMVIGCINFRGRGESGGRTSHPADPGAGSKATSGNSSGWPETVIRPPGCAAT